MPVRAVIHSSVVSTMRARSLLVSAFSGRWPATPRTTDAYSLTSNASSLRPFLFGRFLFGRNRRRRCGAGEQSLQAFLDLGPEMAFAHIRSDRNRLAEADPVGAAMAFDHHAVEAEQDRAIHLPWIELGSELPQRRH